MGTERHDKRTLFIKDSEQEIDVHKLDARLLDMFKEMKDKAEKDMKRADERYLSSPSIENGSRRAEARDHFELCERAYRLQLDHIAEELVKSEENGLAWRDDKGQVIQ